MNFPPNYPGVNNCYGQDNLLSYPVHSKSFQFEPSFKRFTSFPTPEKVYEYGLLGLPNILPLIGIQIPLEYAQDALESAISEIEMSTGMDISPVIHYQAEDLIEGKFGTSAAGTKLLRWPATKIIKVSINYPFPGRTAYESAVIPGSWVFLRKRKMNIIPSNGSIFSYSVNGGLAPMGYFSGVNSSYSPGAMEIVYQSGFDHDQLPSALADLIKTWAAHRFLIDAGMLLFPYNSVSVSIDAVSQSAGINVSTVITAKIEALALKKEQLLNAVTAQFSSIIKSSFVGI